MLALLSNLCFSIINVGSNHSCFGFIESGKEIKKYPKSDQKVKLTYGFFLPLRINRVVKFLILLKGEMDDRRLDRKSKAI